MHNVEEATDVISHHLHNPMIYRDDHIISIDEVEYDRLRSVLPGYDATTLRRERMSLILKKPLFHIIADKIMAKFKVCAINSLITQKTNLLLNLYQRTNHTISYQPFHSLDIMHSNIKRLGL